MSCPNSCITATAKGSISAFLTPTERTYSVFGNMDFNRLSAIGERTLFNPHANNTACGLRTRAGVTTLAFPVQHGNQCKEAARGLEIDTHLAIQPLHQCTRAFIVDA